MSLARPRGKGEGVIQQTIQKVLEKNHHLTQCTLDDLSKGKAARRTQCHEPAQEPSLPGLCWTPIRTCSPILPSQPRSTMLGPEVCPSGSAQELHSPGQPH